MKLYKIRKSHYRTDSENNRKVIFATGQVFASHNGGYCHPERPDRILAIIKAVCSFRARRCLLAGPTPVQPGDAMRVHPPHFFASLTDLPLLKSLLGDRPGAVFESGDMFWNEHTTNCAILAAGTVVDAVEKVLDGEARTAFAAVRPPGHHASEKTAEGFCWMNNAAIAAKKALSRKSVRKVLIVDWDVHHGNGTQDIFYEDSRVLYVSIHRKTIGFYPGTGAAREIGEAAGLGFNVNIPWKKSGMGDLEYVAAFESIVSPLVRDFAADLTLVSAGFDAAEGDRVGGMSVSPACYGWMASELLAAANGRNVVFVLEGGYCLKAMSAAVISVVDVMGRSSQFEKRKMRFENADKTKRALRNCNLSALRTISEVLSIQSANCKSLQQIAKMAEQILTERQNSQRNRVAVITDDDYFSGLGTLSNLMQNLYD